MRIPFDEAKLKSTGGNRFYWKGADENTSFYFLAKALCSKGVLITYTCFTFGSETFGCVIDTGQFEIEVPDSAHHILQDGACQCKTCQEARTRVYNNGYNKALEFMQESIVNQTK